VNKPLFFNVRQHRFNLTAALTCMLNVSPCNEAILGHVNAKTIQKKIYFDREIAIANCDLFILLVLVRYLFWDKGHSLHYEN
jgi:hypothetical protein